MGYIMTVKEQDLYWLNENYTDNKAAEIMTSLKNDNWVAYYNGDADRYEIEFDTNGIDGSTFKWGEWFENDLKIFAKAGVIGIIDVQGEGGELERYSLHNGVVSKLRGYIKYVSPVVI